MDLNSGISGPQFAETREHPGRQLDSPYGDRLAPPEMVEEALGRDLPRDAIVLRSPSKERTEVVVHCPVTLAPLTRPMTDVVALPDSALQDMIDHRAPLGITPQGWQTVLERTHEAFSKAGLLTTDLQVAAGGSSIAGFSSRATTLRKKRFPQNAGELREKLRHSPVRATDESKFQFGVARASGLHERVVGKADLLPQAPWWGIMHRLGLEQPPDLDLQVHSPEIDAALMENRTWSHLAKSGAAGDRWGRWPDDAVSMTFRALDDLAYLFQRDGFNVEFEYLAGDSGRQRIEERMQSDWWSLRSRRRSPVGRDQGGRR